MILFYSFGHLASTLDNLSIARNITLDTFQLAWLWLFIFLLFSFMVIRARLPEHFTLFLNVISATILIFPLETILFAVIPFNQNDERDREALSRIRGEAEAASSLPQIPQNELPDIYYIILDGYERADKLNEFYNYDNSYFIRSLEDRDFYVASSSRSNYLSTDYSLNTSLNLIYVHDLPRNLFARTKYDLLTDHVSDFLREQGYQIVVFESGTCDTELNIKISLCLHQPFKHETSQS
jgi:hypothetical protein